MDIPPFPDDAPTIPIARISYAALLAGDTVESQKVLTACTTDGFFYLDMTENTSGQELLDDAGQLHSLSKGLFDAPVDEKMRYLNDRGKSLFGYKPTGAMKSTDQSNTRDTTEFFNVAKDHLHNITSSRTYPPEMTTSQPLCRSFTQNAHVCAQVIMRTLARQLHLEDEDTFARRADFKAPSGDHLRLTKKSPNPEDNDGHTIGLASHTDFGLVTVLFNWLGGLQIQSLQPENAGQWCFVKPLPGHAIINLGDAMVKFTNGTLKSAKHRVVPAPGLQATVDRYSVVYFSRPADEAIMEVLPPFLGDGTVQIGGKLGEEGKRYTTREWMVRRLVQMGH